MRLGPVAPAYILFRRAAGEFAFGCVIAVFTHASDHDAVAFDWHGSDEVSGDGWTELQDNGFSVGEISYHIGDKSGFCARRWTSSTAF